MTTGRLNICSSCAVACLSARSCVCVVRLCECMHEVVCVLVKLRVGGEKKEGGGGGCKLLCKHVSAMTMHRCCFIVLFSAGVLFTAD